MKIEYLKASPVDYPGILALQKLAYVTEAEIYGNYTIPPMVQSPEEMNTECAKKTVLKAVADGIIVGSVRAWLDDKGSCHIDRVMTHPDYRGKGIATEMMRRIEGEFPCAVRFELFTGELSTGNIRLYERLGYRIFSTRPLNDQINFVFMEKPSVIEQ